MINKCKTYWWVDAVLFAGFLITFFLDITGLPLHQWIGISAGIFVTLHLLLHWKWVKTTTKNFSTRATNRSRWYYLLDILLLFGFSAIILTGLVISTWLQLNLTNYAVWLTVHIVFSIETLVLIVLKLALHSKWIINTFRKVFIKDNPVLVSSPVLHQPLQISEKRFERREFLRLMGVIGAASVFAFTNAAKGLSMINSSDESTQLEDVKEIVSVISENTEVTPVNVATLEPTIEQVTTDLVEVENTPVPTKTVVVPAVTSCTIQCSRHCSYPGRCHRYTDSNGNRLCDLGECM